MTLNNSILRRLAMMVVLLVPVTAHATTFQLLYSFTGGTDGAGPALTLAKLHGILYGIATLGGDLGSTSVDCDTSYACGTIFKFDPTTKMLTTLYRFTGGADGGHPNDEAPLAIDRYGALYGVTDYGGDVSGCGSGFGCGTVFKLDPVSGILTTLYTFTTEDPPTSVFFGPHEVLYGTTCGGGCLGRSDLGNGTVFQLTPPMIADAPWTKSTVYTFAGGNDGAGPSQLVLGNGGKFYGTALGGATACYGGCGMVFELTPPPRGQTTWTKTTLHLFTGGADGGFPAGGLVFDRAGMLDGVADVGGSSDCNSGCGTVYTLDPVTAKLTTLHSFIGSDGKYPSGGVTIDGAGELFGTTADGAGADEMFGTVFELDPVTGTLTTLHAFSGTDGKNPETGVVLRDGVLFGTVGNGGIAADCVSIGGCGTLFKLTR